MSENKYRSWVFTWNESRNHDLVTEGVLKALLESVENIEKYVFQLERGENTHKEHFQGCFTTCIRVRHSTLLKRFEEVLKRSQFRLLESDVEELMRNLTIDKMNGTWEEAFAYCTKSDSRLAEPVMSHKLKQYTGSDVEFLSEKDNRFPWQQSIMEEFLDEAENNFKDPDDRKIVWITDLKGNSGKSKLVKYLAHTYPDVAKISFGSATQLRSGLIAAGRRTLYIVDMTFSTGEDDSLPTMLSVLEDLKNGYLVSVMYGKYQELMIEPPHIVVFSNQTCPKGMLADERWQSYRISETKFLYSTD